MVDTIDVNVGRVVEYLKKTGEYDNTFILFMSDNGAEGAALEAIPVMGANIKQTIHKYYDNSHDNIGAWNSFAWLGPLWAQASTAPSRLFKGFPSEGGILVPCIVKPPVSAFSSNFQPGTFNRSFSTVMDFAPTFLELAGISLPPDVDRAMPTPLNDGTTATRRMTTFRGRDVYAMRGQSWLPYFSSPSPSLSTASDTDHAWAIHSESEAVGWELFARGALRKGDWKIVHLDRRNGGAGPEKLKELLAHWDEYVVECGIVWGETAAAAGHTHDEAPGQWDDDTELQRTWMGARGGETPV
ncbi:hypothetical protein SCUCBS95973_008827 [Sporothrix curviconia]|uniref:Sulfatase N-terminal domain-containing protein n=1 Tax=Sporothrix curviconia TaxID=1260050 RepID=A0ABP0CS35_9PEZI